MRSRWASDLFTVAGVSRGGLDQRGRGCDGLALQRQVHRERRGGRATQAGNAVAIRVDEREQRVRRRIRPASALASMPSAKKSSQRSQSPCRRTAFSRS